MTATKAKNVGQTVAQTGGIMVASLLLSRILGLLRDTVIASQFGLSSANDSYRIAIQIPDLLFMLIAGGGLSSAFIPVFAEFWHTDRRREAWKVFSVVVTICSIIVTALILVAWIAAPAVVHYIGDGQSESLMPAATSMSRIMLPAQFAFLVGSVLLATLYARRDFIAPGLAPNVYNIGIIVGAAILPKLFGFGIEGVAWGALGGAILGNLVIPALSMARAGSSFRPSLDYRAPGVDKFFKLLLPVILGFSLPSMVNIVTQKFASGYGLPGANTALSYANNLMQAPLGIFGQSLALAVFPVLTQFFAQDRMDLYREQISKTLRTVLYLCIAASVLMFVLAPQITHIIYGYGKAKNAEQLDWIAECLRIYCLAIPAWCMQPLLMRGFFSLQKTLKPIAIGTVMTGIFIVECIVLKHNPIGFRALPWATNVAAIALAIVLFMALEREIGALDHRGIVRTIGKGSVAALALGFTAWIGSLLFQLVHRRVVEMLLFLFVTLLASWAFYFASRLLKMPETEYLDRALQKINRRRRPISESEAGEP